MLSGNIPRGMVIAALSFNRASPSYAFQAFVPHLVSSGTRSTTSTTRNINVGLESNSRISNEYEVSRTIDGHKMIMTSTSSPANGDDEQRQQRQHNDGYVPPSAMPIGADTLSRRGFFSSLGTKALSGAAVLGGLSLVPDEASANGMLDFPPARLNNRYFLMRSGEGGADKEGRIQSHPIDKLHMDNRLTDQGVAEAQRAAGVLKALGVDDAFIWADISSRAQDTAKILAQELDIRQDRVVPEYAFLEPRGMGVFDGEQAATVLPEVYKADENDLSWRPPPNTDGTPNESVDDVFVRVRQLMSKLETQYQGEDVVIVGADSDCLSVLQSFVLGEDLGKHSKYYLRPGEGRQLRVSIDTEFMYRDRRKAKGRLPSDDGDDVWGSSSGMDVAASAASFDMGGF